jgi:hypothetical protein
LLRLSAAIVAALTSDELWIFMGMNMDMPINSASMTITLQMHATIAEIATLTYFARKPPSALPDDVINTAVMDAIIDRRSMNWVMQFPKSEFKQLKNHETISVEEIEAQLRERAVIEEFATNAQRLRHARALLMLNEEMAIRARAHEKDLERDTPGRSRQENDAK